MKKETEERFQKRLLIDINRLCELDNKLYHDKDKFERIFEYYNRYRTVIHNRIEQGCEEKKELIRMDRHKVAAAFFCAILRANPIGKKPDADKFFERTINIQLALIFSAKYVIDLFNISDPNNSELEKKIFSRMFKFPKCKNSKSKNYLTNFIMLIEDIQKNSLDIDSDKFQPNLLFVISHLFFLLDAYSYQENYCLTIESASASQQ
ncbi:MAG: hypothetical protein LBI04_06450 [Treponema sp.]|nr:hypothetical protein [Treponema sp.]